MGQANVFLILGLRSDPDFFVPKPDPKKTLKFFEKFFIYIIQTRYKNIYTIDEIRNTIQA